MLHCYTKVKSYIYIWEHCVTDLSYKEKKKKEHYGYLSIIRRQFLAF